MSHRAESKVDVYNGDSSRMLLASCILRSLTNRADR